MAVTNQVSDQLGKTTVPPVEIDNPADSHAKLRFAYFQFTQVGAGDAGSTAALVKLPSGRVRIFAGLSRISHSALGAARVMDVGHTGYTQPDGTEIAADADFLHSAADVSAAGAFVPSDETGNGETIAYESDGQVTIEAKVTGGTFLNNATLEGFIVYAKD